MMSLQLKEKIHTHTHTHTHTWQATMDAQIHSLGNLGHVI